MNDGFTHDSVVSFLKDNLLIVGVSLVGVALLIYGFFTLPATSSEEEIVYEAGSEASTSARVGSENFYVDIAGAVLKPGVYEMSDESRVADVLKKAGGLSEKADTQGIAKTMNLATRITDGMKIYVPFVGETAVLGVQAGSTGQTSATGNLSTQKSGLININTASTSELESLPGIGAVTAGKIVSGRPYTSVEELKTKKSVGASVYDKIKDLVTVN